MDLTIPYTFYPVSLPHWMAWTLFGLAMLGGIAAGVARGRIRGRMSGLRAGLIGAVGFLVVTMVASMVITFFVHDEKERSENGAHGHGSYGAVE